MQQRAHSPPTQGQDADLTGECGITLGCPTGDILELEGLWIDAGQVATAPLACSVAEAMSPDTKAARARLSAISSGVPVGTLVTSSASAGPFGFLEYGL